MNTTPHPLQAHLDEQLSMLGVDESTKRHPMLTVPYWAKSAEVLDIRSDEDLIEGNLFALAQFSRACSFHLEGEDDVDLKVEMVEEVAIAGQSVGTNGPTLTSVLSDFTQEKALAFAHILMTDPAKWEA